MRERLVKALQDLLVFLRRHFHVNSGGCCYVAYVIAKNLEKHNIPFQVVLYYELFGEDECYEDISVEDIEEKIKERVLGSIGTGDDTCNHYSIIIDGEDLNPDFEDRPSKILNLNSEDLKWIYYKAGDWCEVYNHLINSYINFYIKNTFDLIAYEEGN